LPISVFVSRNNRRPDCEEGFGNLWSGAASARRGAGETFGDRAVRCCFNVSDSAKRSPAFFTRASASFGVHVSLRGFSSSDQRTGIDTRPVARSEYTATVVL
jgi:hypothetical protein